MNREIMAISRFLGVTPDYILDLNYGQYLELQLTIKKDQAEKERIRKAEQQKQKARIRRRR